MTCNERMGVRFSTRVSRSHRRRIFAAMLSFVCGLDLLASNYATAQVPQMEQPNSAEAKKDAKPSLPLPAHPGRHAEDPAHTSPKESQPDRESRRESPRYTTRTSMPVPGKPGRGLEPLAELNEPQEGAAEEPAPTLLGIIPHSIYDGGISIEAIYTGETFTKASGGLSNRRPTNYRSNLDLVAIVETERMGWWESGRLFVYGQNLSGKPLSASDVGDVQLFSNLDSTISETERPNFTTVAEYWYEHLLIDGRLRVKVGKQDANVDFALTDLGGEFVHSSFGVPPMIPFPTFPSQALGIASFLNVTDTLTLGTAVYDGSLPSGPTGVRWGFDTLGHNGAISMYQLQFAPQLGPDGQLPNTTRVGMWHHSDPNVWTEFTTDPNPRTFVQNYGVFASTDQMIFKEEYGTDDEQGLGVFVQFGWAPSNRNMIQEYYGTGLVYRGLIPGRDHDTTGLAMANALFSKELRQVSEANGEPMGTHETAVELFHKVQATPFFSLQPDFQMIANPGGRYRDAFVPGLRFEVIL